MSNNRLRFIRGHVDALRDLCGDMRQDSAPVRAVDLLKSKVDHAASSRDTGAYYKAGYEVTQAVASWIQLLIDKGMNDGTRGRGGTKAALPKSVETKRARRPKAGG